jgi:Rod binding domain-containing protein
MAISLATDIVADVLNAGDPVAARAATERLTRLQSASGVDFAAESAASAASAVARAARTDAPAVSRPAAASGDASSAVYRKFEAFVLQTFVESMLPRNDQIFGKGTAGNVWRSMLAEQLGTQLAKSGGVGIARVLAKAHPTDAAPAADDGK